MYLSSSNFHFSYIILFSSFSTQEHPLCPTKMFLKCMYTQGNDVNKLRVTWTLEINCACTFYLPKGTKYLYTQRLATALLEVLLQRYHLEETMIGRVNDSVCSQQLGKKCAVHGRGDGYLTSSHYLYQNHPLVSGDFAMQVWHNTEVGFEVLTAVVMNRYIFWDITPCSPHRYIPEDRTLIPRYFASKIKTICWENL
jgi:hypothetical protein